MGENTNNLKSTQGVKISFK